MALRRWTSFFIPLCHRPWPPSPAVAQKLSPSQLIEEEKTPHYHAEHFYPAELGQVLHGRYQIATKLGHGSSSTVWLARDLHRWRWESEQYVAIKIGSRNPRKDGTKHELAMLKHIPTARPGHDGWHFIRKLVDSFTVGAVGAEHTCLVFEPMREPLWLYSRRFVDDIIPPHVLKVMLRMILEGLDYLHTECEIIHADLKPDNIMVKMEDPTRFGRDAEVEYHNPLPQKHADGRIIYLSRNDYGPFNGPVGLIRIVDFDHSVLGNIARTGCIQADIYRAPEVILDAGYSYPVDIWSLGVMLWDLLEGRKLFKASIAPKIDDYNEPLHLAYIHALLGAPPDGCTSGKRASMFYDSKGSFRTPDLIPQDFSFESVVGSMEGIEKELFIKFVRRMLRWCPSERSTAKELLEDPWLYSDHD